MRRAARLPLEFSIDESHAGMARERSSCPASRQREIIMQISDLQPSEGYREEVKAA